MLRNCRSGSRNIGRLSRWPRFTVLWVGLYTVCHGLPCVTVAEYVSI
eukprot:COSAG06_NODE_59397_length_274_cov_0.640000_1_plen_46_part_01